MLRALWLPSLAVGLAMLAAIAAAPRPAAGQGILIDLHPGHPIRLPRPIWPRPQEPQTSSYKIDSIDVDVRLDDATAKIQVSQTFTNTGAEPVEACFVFPLPYDGAIDQFTLLVDGKEYPAKLLSKEEARRRYEEIVQARPGAVGMGGFRDVSNQRVSHSGRRVAHLDVAVCANLSQVSRAGRFLISASYGQVLGSSAGEDFLARDH
jgi:hypothetical protein